MLPASVHPAALLGPLVRILLAPFNPVALFISLQVRVLPAPVCPSRLRVRALQAPFGLAAAQGHAGAQFALGSGMSMTRRPSRTRRGHPLVPARRGQGHADALFSLGAMHVAARGCPAGATPRPALLLRGSGARGGERHVRRVRPGRGLCQGAGAARDYAPSPPVVWMPLTADDCCGLVSTWGSGRSDVSAKKLLESPLAYPQPARFAGRPLWFTPRAALCSPRGVNLDLT